MNARHRIAIAVSTVAMSLLAGPAVAQETPASACKGTTIAWLAQGADGLVDTRGIGRLAASTGGQETDPYTVPEIIEFVDASCAL